MRSSTAGLAYAVGGLAGLGALALTSARLTTSEAYVPTLLMSFTPYAIPAYAALLAVALLLLRRDAARRRLAAAGAALAAVGLVLHGVWFAPLLVADDVPPGGGTAVRVLSLNTLKGRADPDDVAALIREEDPDILVLLEVRPPLRGRLDALVPDDLPRVAGAGYRLDTQIFSRYASPGAEELGLYLGAWRTELTVGEQVVQTYAAHPYNPVLRPTTWRQDHTRLREAVTDTDGPALVIGDLNATVDHPPLRALAALGIRDAAGVAGAGWQPTFPSDGPLPSLIAIDHVLLRGPWSVDAVRTAHVSGADHRAVVADLVLHDPAADR